MAALWLGAAFAKANGRYSAMMATSQQGRIDAAARHFRNFRKSSRRFARSYPGFVWLWVTFVLVDSVLATQQPVLAFILFSAAFTLRKSMQVRQARMWAERGRRRLEMSWS
jgi:hypothetical protein